MKVNHFFLQTLKAYEVEDLLEGELASQPALAITYS